MRYRVMTACVVLLPLGANAHLNISSKPTQNILCSAGICSATASTANLNISDLAEMLDGENVTVATGSLANDIVLKQALSWASTARLILDAKRSVILDKSMTVAGTGGLTITTNHGGRGGRWLLEPMASVQFWDLSSALSIGGNQYTLVADVKSLSDGIASNPGGHFALAKPYDASADGTYQGAAVPTTLTGMFDGLGNGVSNLSLSVASSGSYTEAGFFAHLGNNGAIQNARLLNMLIEGNNCQPGNIALLVASVDQASVEYSSAVGAIILQPGCGSAVGGLVGASEGQIVRSSSSAQITMDNDRGGAGGLVGANFGIVSESYATGMLVARSDFSSSFGGLVALNEGTIANSYSLDSLHEGKDCCGSNNSFGGLVGENDGIIVSSYAAGKIALNHSGDKASVRGGLIGTDNANPGELSFTYWDLDKGIADPSQGAGNIPNDPGITGLTDVQLQTELPAGFSSKIWAANMKVNDGYPYLKTAAQGQ